MTTAAPTMARPGRRDRGEWLKYAFLIAVLLTAFYPLIMMFAISFKTNQQFVANPWFFDSPGDWHWENWGVAWEIVSRYIANSAFTAVTSTVLSLSMATLTAYAVARYRFPGRNIIYYGLIATMFLPGTSASLVTLFNILSQLNLLNTLWAIIIVTSVGGQVIAVFILRQFIEDIPRDLFDSAQIDGAGHFAQIRHIMLPMCGSIIGVLAIMNFLGAWNELMLTLVTIRDEQSYTIPVGLMRLDGEYAKQWGELMAGYAIASLPLVVLFFFTMRFFVKGLSAGAIKG